MAKSLGLIFFETLSEFFDEGDRCLVAREARVGVDLAKRPLENVGSIPMRDHAFGEQKPFYIQSNICQLDNSQINASNR